MPTNTTIASTYYYDLSGRLIRESIMSSYTMGSIITSERVYLYDESGVIGMICKDESSSATYYFDKNIRGDVIGIYDANGTRIVKYGYDSWGNCTILSATDYTVANANPFRYRSYYYDTETGFYYLNSRYYSPAWRRFLSPDSTSYLDPKSPNGLNLYAYCNNDPVNYSDPSGHSVVGILVVAFFIGAATGAGISFTTQYISGGFDLSEVNPWLVLSDAIFGGISGVLAASGIGGLSAALLSSSLDMLQVIVNSAITGEDISAIEVAIAGVIGFASSYIPETGINAKSVSSKHKTIMAHIENSKGNRRADMYTIKRKVLNEYILKRSGNYLVSTIATSAVAEVITFGVEGYWYGFGNI